MTTDIHDITTAPKTSSTRKKVGMGVAIGVFAAGALLLIDDQVKKVFSRREAKDDQND